MNKLDYGSGRKPKRGFKTSDYSGLPIFDYMIVDYRVVDADDNEFDVIHCRNVIHHIPEDDLHKLFSEFKRLLCYGGYLIISEPAEEFYVQNKILDIIWYRFLYYDRDIFLQQRYVDYRSFMDGFKELTSYRDIKNDVRVFQVI